MAVADDNRRATMFETPDPPPPSESPVQDSSPRTIKFDLPTDLNTFTGFPRLPAELRHQIWESTLTTPGMHFLRVEPFSDDDAAGPFATSWYSRALVSPGTMIMSFDESRAAEEVAHEVSLEEPYARSQPAELKPLFPNTRADISYYTTLNKQLAKLGVTSSESSFIAKKLASKPGILKLNNGRIISLDPGSDAIYLEYVPDEVFEVGCQFIKSLECAGLDQIRQVALRFCHKWFDADATGRCPRCGRIHVRLDSTTYPRHIYKFIAQCLPNLERFYFIDYLLVRKQPDADQQGGTGDVEIITDNRLGQPQIQATPPSCKFESGNRKYYEADSDHWKVNSKVFETASWVKDRFVQYARASRLSKHKNPENVEFGVLACEWVVEPPAESKATPTSPSKKGRNKRSSPEEHAVRRSRRLRHQTLPPIRDSSPSLAGPQNLDFVFGDPAGNSFDFSFSFPMRSRGQQ